MRARRGRTSGLAAVALAVLALSACQIPPRSATQNTAQSATPAASETPEQAARGAAGPEAAPQTAPDRTETAALPPAPRIDDDPARLMGLDAAGLAKLLGAPELLRREPPAEVWQYRGESCVFDVFLYEAAGGQRVTYLEARDATARRIDARGCLNQLLRARLAMPLG